MFFFFKIVMTHYETKSTLFLVRNHQLCFMILETDGRLQIETSWVIYVFEGCFLISAEQICVQIGMI